MKRLLIILAILLVTLAPLAAQAGPAGFDFNLSDIAPVGVIGLAIAITGLFKRYAPADISLKFVWVPPVVVGILGAILLTNPMTARLLIWNAFSWAAGAAFVVLIVKRMAPRKTHHIPKSDHPVVR
jgi:hypothetical protein